MEYAMKTGFGAATRREGDLIVTALVAVNAIGGVLDRASGKILAGARETRNGKVRVLSVEETLRRAVAPRSADAHTPNTTLGVIVTNARLSKGEAAKLAVRAHDGYARAIDPVHSSLDGDTIFTLATATVTADIDLVGWLATEAMETAVHSAAKTAETAYGFPAMRDM
jgi:L-aminopeptidase/D-esterase-like protein